MNINQNNGVSPAVGDDGNDQNGLDEINQRTYGTQAKKPPSPMRDEAYYGLAGDVVKLVAPDTEACPEALLIQLLVGLGNMMGRGVYMKQGCWHHSNEFVCIVGDSSTGRKGTSWRVLESLLTLLEPEWRKQCVKVGIATGEALINEIRDERSVMNRGKKDKDTGEVETMIEPGVSDKRALILEQEFSRFLSVSGRQGNPISEVLREAFDSPRFLSCISKTSPGTATNPHVSLIGHITPSELTKRMASTDRSNGFANRFLWIETYWRHDLPFASPPEWKDHGPLVSNLRNALAWATETARAMRWSQEGAKAWAKWYKNREKTIGDIGEITKRAEVHTLRLAMIYAVLDCRQEINGDHFSAACAVWNYAAQSARRIFGNGTGDKRADQLNWRLQRAGKMTLTEISDSFGHNLSSIDIQEKIALLVANGSARIGSETNEKGKLVPMLYVVTSGNN